MKHAPDGGLLILVVHDVEETRDGLEKLLTGDGYRVEASRAEDDAVARAQRAPPDLLLVNLGLPPAEVIAVARRIRDRAGLHDEIPVVIFCSEASLEGEKVALGGQVYITRPDNFNQLRRFLTQLLSPPHPKLALGVGDLSQTTDRFRS